MTLRGIKPRIVLVKCGDCGQTKALLSGIEWAHYCRRKRRIIRLKTLSTVQRDLMRVKTVCLVDCNNLVRT